MSSPGITGKDPGNLFIVEQAAPADEQEVCVWCGFCCDGTLFLQAGLWQGEKGSLPDKIEQNVVSGKEGDYFLLPCGYFDGKCTIYDSKRAVVCSAYRCQLLHNLAERKIALSEAKETVLEARRLREEILSGFRQITGYDGSLYFRKVLAEMGKLIKESGNGPAGDEKIDILMARCNIFESLLIKHFRSESDFDKMIFHEQVLQKQ